MSGYSGRELVVRLGPYKAVTTLERLTRAGGVQSKTITATRSEIDVTNDDSGGWREVHEDAGRRSQDLSFSGIMKAGDYHDLVDRFYSGDRNMVVAIRHPSALNMQEGGEAFLQSLETGAEDDGAVTFSATLLFSNAPRRYFGEGFVFASGGGLFPFDFFTGAAGDQINEAGDLPTTEPDSMVGATGGGGSAWVVFDDLSVNPPVGKISAVNIADGTFTDLPAGNLGSREPRPRGIAADTSASPVTHLWVSGEQDDLYRVTLSTGNATLIGSGLAPNGAWQRPEDLAYARGTLYMLGNTGAGRKLYSISTSDASPTEIMDITPNNSQAAFGLESDGVNLFALYSDRIAQVDPVAKTIRNLAYDGVTGFGNADFSGSNRKYMAIT